MKKKRGLCMAAGGLIEDKEAAWARRKAEIYASTGLSSKRREPEPEVAPAPPPAPAPAPQRRGGLMGAFDALTNRKRQIEEAAGYAQGGIVRGPGGPEDDKVPMQIAGKDVRLSNTEAVLPARTVQALGGPKAVEQLIEVTNGKPPVKGGLREGGKYFTGTTGDTIDKKELRPEFRGNAAGQPVTPAANAGAQAMQNTAAQAAMNKMPDADPVRAQQAAQANALANATGPKLETPTNPNVGAGKVSPEAQAFKAGQGTTPGATSSPPPAATPEAPKSRLGNAVGGAKSIGGKLIKGSGYTMAAMGAADAIENGLTVQNAAEMAGGVLSSDAGRAAVMNTLRGAAPLAGAAGATLGVGAAAAGGYMYGSALRDKAESGEKMNRLEATLTAAGENLGKAYARYAPEWMGGLDKRTIELADKVNGGAGWTTIKSLRDGDPQKQAAANRTKAAEKSPVGATVVEGSAKPNNLMQPNEGPGQDASSVTTDPVTKLPVSLAAAAKANDGRGNFIAGMDATKYNPAEGTGVITRAPGKDGLRSGTFIGGPSAADAARDAKFEAAGYGKDMYGNWMTPQRQALQQAGKEWEERNYSKQVSTQDERNAISAAEAQQKAFAERQDDINRALEDASKVFGRNKRASAMAAAVERQRGLLAEMGMAHQSALKNQEMGLRQQQGDAALQLEREKAAAAAATASRPSFRDQLELAKFQYEQQKDAANRNNLQGNNERDYRNTVIKQNNERIEKWLDTMAPTQGLEGDDLRAAQQRRAFLQEAVRSGWGGNVAIDPAAFESEMPKHSQQAKATMALYDALSKDSGVGAFFRNGFRDATLSQQAIVPKSYDEKRDILVMPDGYEIPGKSVWGNDADIRAAVLARMKQAAEEGKK